MTGPTSDVWATNKEGEKRRFTRMTWNLLKKGKDGTKDGWTELPDTIIHNTVQANTTLAKPNTGDAVKKTQVIDNVIIAKNDQLIDNTAKNQTVIAPSVVTDEQKAEFMKAAEGLKKGDIKDFLDRQDPKVPYSNGSKDKNYFPNLLAEHLKYDIVALQKAFN